MMKHQKPLIRRTFLQERFEVLIKKQLQGEATFAELTELDELINRDPKLKHIVLEEMDAVDNETDVHKNTNTTISPAPKHQTFGEKILAIIKSFYVLYNKKSRALTQPGLS